LKTGTFPYLSPKLKPSMPANIKSIELRNLQIEDYKQLKNSMIESYPEMEESFWRRSNYTAIGKVSRRTTSNRCRWVVGSALSL
jgi:hypothetical protein